jgi:hypothetical protein
MAVKRSQILQHRYLMPAQRVQFRFDFINLMIDPIKPLLHLLEDLKDQLVADFSHFKPSPR